MECIRSGYGSLEVLPQRYYLSPLLPQRGEHTRRRRRPAVLAGGGVAAVSVSSCTCSDSLRSAVRVVSVSFAAPRLLVLLKGLLVLLHGIADGNGDVKRKRTLLAPARAKLAEHCFCWVYSWSTCARCPGRSLIVIATVVRYCADR